LTRSCFRGYPEGQRIWIAISLSPLQRVSAWSGRDAHPHRRCCFCVPSIAAAISGTNSGLGRKGIGERVAHGGQGGRSSCIESRHALVVSMSVARPCPRSLAGGIEARRFIRTNSICSLLGASESPTKAEILLFPLELAKQAFLLPVPGAEARVVAKRSDGNMSHFGPASEIQPSLGPDLQP
jgi:hypothetical protein